MNLQSLFFQSFRRRTVGFVLVLSLLLPVAVFGVRAARQVDRAYIPVSFGPPAFSMTPVGNGFNSVTEITHAGDGRIFVAERAGVVKIFHPDGNINVFLDIHDKVISHRGEYGFFDIAFHPDYADPAAPGHGLFYVTYTTGFDDGVTLDVDFIIARFRVSSDPNVADRASETLIMKEKQSFDVHKGGGMEFDPRDHMLYIGMGDDRLLEIAQSDHSPKGKVIRLDVDKVPPDLVGDGRGYLSDEIWASGLRNPWRIDVDHLSNQIFVGEVGDALWEEINIVPLGVKGFNYGWPCMEGPLVIPEANDMPQCQSPWLFSRAIHEYEHRDGSGRCAVIGGKINRPSYDPADNRFIFADMCTREVFALANHAGAWERALLGILDDTLISSIGEDVRGVQYIGTMNTSGPIYRLYIP